MKMFTLPVDAVNGNSKQRLTTVRLAPNHASVAEMPNPGRSKWIEHALEEFFSWETYKETDWIAGDIQDGHVWLDAVEMGVEYRTRTKLLSPVKLNLSKEISDQLDAAERIVELKRPNLKGKGISSGIIRTAVTQKMYNERSGAFNR